jgi:type II secretory pathway pseudopilin PulG
MTPPRPRRHASPSAAHTLVEVLVAAALLSIAATLVYAVLFGGSRSYFRARARLDVLSSCRAALAQFESDVHQTVSAVEVADGGAELTLRLLDPGPAGLPEAAPDGRFKEVEIRYRYDAPTRRLLRNEEILGRDLPDVAFAQGLLDVAGRQVPVVTATITAILEDRPFSIEATAVPRAIAGWASSPGWVFTTLGAPYEFKAEQ